MQLPIEHRDRPDAHESEGPSDPGVQDRSAGGEKAVGRERHVERHEPGVPHKLPERGAAEARSLPEEVGQAVDGRQERRRPDGRESLPPRPPVGSWGSDGGGRHSVSGTPASKAPGSGIYTANLPRGPALGPPGQGLQGLTLQFWSLKRPAAARRLGESVPSIHQGGFQLPGFWAPGGQAHRPGRGTAGSGSGRRWQDDAKAPPRPIVRPRATSVTRPTHHERR